MVPTILFRSMMVFYKKIHNHVLPFSARGQVGSFGLVPIEVPQFDFFCPVRLENQSLLNAFRQDHSLRGLILSAVSYVKTKPFRNSFSDTYLTIPARSFSFFSYIILALAKELADIGRWQKGKLFLLNRPVSLIGNCLHLIKLPHRCFKFCSVTK